MKLPITLFLLTLVGGVLNVALSINCKKICRKIYDPYCLTYEDGTQATFANYCVLEIEICLNGLNSRGEPLVGVQGACDEEYSYYPDNITDNLDDLDT